MKTVFSQRLTFSVLIILAAGSALAAADIAISKADPADGASTALLNPLLGVEITHAQNRSMEIVFSIGSKNGDWQEIQRFSDAKSGFYRVRPRNVRERKQAYQWKVSAGVGNNTVEKVYSFTVVNYVGQEEKIISEASCWKYGYMRRGSTPGRFYVATQAHYGRGGAAYDINKGWYETFSEVPYLGHPCWGYWDGKYHRIGNVGQGGAYAPHVGQMSSTTFADLKLMNPVQHTRKVGHWMTPSNPEPSTFTFTNNRAWIMAIDYDKEAKQGHIRYWEWSKKAEKEGAGWRGMGWQDPVSIGTTTISGGHAAILPVDRETWYCYVLEGTASGSNLGHNSTMHYFKSENGGKTWGEIHDTGIPGHACWSHVSFARYGNNYYVFLTDQGETVTYFSTDGENWNPESKRIVSPDTDKKFWQNSHGTVLHQSALIYTSNRGVKYIDEQYGFIVPVDTMLANPGVPVNPSIRHQETVAPQLTEVALQVEVKGEQVYDVAFYWADHTFIEVDRLLKNGDVAQVTVTGLEAGKTYSWYAISRGAGLEYYGEPDSTSDEAWTQVHTFVMP